MGGIRECEVLSNMKKKLKKLVYICRIGWKKVIFCFLSKTDRGKYYIIKPDNYETGLFSYFNLFLPQIMLAKTAGWIPVIDMQNEKNTYLEQHQIGELNAWEFYFEQPGHTSIKEISEDNCVSNFFKPFRSGPYSGRAFYEDWYGEKTFWRRFVSEEVCVKPDILKHVAGWWSKTFKEEDRVLGVLCRGSDYLRLKPTGHARQPEPEQCIEKTKELMKVWNCNKVYLSTEDERILQLFRKELENGLFYYDKAYIKDPGTGYVTQVRLDRFDDARKQGEEYLIQILILSKCNALLAGACGGTIGAELFSKGYEREFIWDLGLYS